MARMLRSRSMRVLRGGGLKETHQQETDSTTPLPSHFPIEVDRLKAATPVSRPEDERVETPNMVAQRPTTSGGSGDRGKLFHKKVAPAAQISSTDDDLALHSPSNKSNTSFLYAAEIHEEKEGIIGIALGSPTMASHTTNFVTSHSGTVTYISSNNTSPNRLPEPADTKQESPKPKLSRWKSIFKKSPLAPQQQTTTFYQLAPAVSPARIDSHHDNDSLDSRNVSPMDFSPPPFKPEIRESRRLPKGHPQPPVETRPHVLTVGTNSSKPKSSFMRSASSPNPPPKDRSATVPMLVVSASPSGSPRNGDRPLLDVDIPSIQMERYSVMFAGCSNLLQSTSSPSSNLLVRRQGNSERLKPLTELSKKNEGDGAGNGNGNGTLKPQRRATSPSFPKSPSAGLSLFPQPTDGSHRRTPSPRSLSVHRPRPLQRSKTAPSSSPNKQNFSIPMPSNDRQRDASQDSRRVQLENGDIEMSMQLPMPTPSTACSLESESEAEAEDATIVVTRPGPAQSWKPLIDEPQWEIVSKPVVTNPLSLNPPSPTPASQDAPSSPHVEPESHAQIQITSPTTAPLSADLAGKKASLPSRSGGSATLGVARSVSVSRANRPEFLKPVLVKRATDGNERLVDRRALTPTLVELKNRKSQRVQLVEV
ncbi:hypothetical protein K504DRAFT_464400 [Pleomassaria siparia CBS 279.74]|uniref:Uncharacterized protein n=1 Tax=Pleomassaria siparia CBS 279.74 TaxID=1314801 RepID=A0A6G1KI61_9PLEO|nr:hypothetical protein K504DRAFT_464400 [Pleomassaria siparia CBS 279.74]